ncbi:MAG: site-2 protease family protein [Clostridia bacterium]|nr:site-2 protease family protein [Clostridia bacterium]
MSQIWSVLQTVGYLALAIFLLMLMITIHEFGHYITAKILKFKVYEFSIGMGKPIYKKTKKDGEIFAIRMIPVGGYCSFGEDNAEIPDTDPNSFNHKEPWKRLIVMFSGAFFNFLSAIFFAVILLSLMGYGRVVNANTLFHNKDFDETDPTQPETITLAYVLNLDHKVIDTDGNQFTFMVDDNTKMLIEEVNGKSMNIFTGSSTILENAYVGDDVKMLVTWRDTATGAVIKKEVILQSISSRQWEALSKAEYTLPLGDKIYHNVGGAILKAVPFSFEIAGMIFKILGQLVTGQLGMNSIGGTVATISVMGSSIGKVMTSYPIDMVFAQIFYLLTLISINLAVFNWLPIPSLDGARMVFVIIEWIRGKPINRELEAKIHTVGIICLLGFVVFADLFWVVNNLSLHFLL